MRPDSIIYIPLQLKSDSRSRKSEFREFCHEFLDTEDLETTVATLSNELTKEISLSQSDLQKDKEHLVFLILKKVILDLINQGWQLELNKSNFGLSYSLFPDNSKELVRKRHSFEREALLKKESVQKFILKMENGGISSLMRDGNELIEILKSGKSDAIKPYLQFVEGNQRCEYTGLRLMDIWRYFRYTWVNAYRSTPGRNMRILVRDAEAPDHAIIGIASLGNTVIQQTVRDNWIGWHVEAFLKNFKCPADLVNWCSCTIDKKLNDLYQKDLIQQGLYSETDVQKPTETTIVKLKQESEKAIKIYRQTPTEAEFLRRTERPGADWSKRAETHLYKSKRCAKLASLLSIRRTLQEAQIFEHTDFFKSKKVQTAINQLIRFVKAEHVGENMMDITTCGAIAPYNHLLGGKLVSMLVCSPEVIEFYKKKYTLNERIIASSMKGSPVKRVANLVLLTTTSLYEVGASQYNRIKIPINEKGTEIKYHKLGLTEGFGTFHLSQETLSLMELLIDTSDRRVNSVFGEGPSPLMRKIRGVLNLIGLPSHTILNHKSRRIVYGISLAENFREILTGLAHEPNYVQPITKSKHLLSEYTKEIADYWKERWFDKRIENSDILEQVAKHTGSDHGSRVKIISD